MRIGINPHWGSTIDEKKIGDWSNFAVNQGFGALEFSITFRMVGKGLGRVFDRKVMIALNHARKRGLRFHVLVEPFHSRLSFLRAAVWHQSVWKASEILNFLKNHLHPDSVLLHSGTGSGRPERDMKQLARSFRILRDRYPELRLGMKMGAEGNCLKTIDDAEMLLRDLPEAGLALDIGWAAWINRDDPSRLQQLLGVIGKNLIQVNWHNFTVDPLLFHLPLSRGELEERDYYKFLGYLVQPERIWCVLDYRDRSRKHYPSDKLMLEDLDFRRA
jgi:hypothetical protein